MPRSIGLCVNAAGRKVGRDADDLARIAAGLVAPTDRVPDRRRATFSTAHLRRLRVTTGNAIERLETLVRMPAGEITELRRQV